MYKPERQIVFRFVPYVNVTCLSKWGNRRSINLISMIRIYGNFRRHIPLDIPWFVRVKDLMRRDFFRHFFFCCLICNAQRFHFHFYLGDEGIRDGEREGKEKKWETKHLMEQIWHFMVEQNHRYHHHIFNNFRFPMNGQLLPVPTTSSTPNPHRLYI